MRAPTAQLSIPVIVLVLLLVMMSLGPIMTATGDSGGSSTLRQGIYAAIFLAALFASRTGRTTFDVLVVPIHVLLLLGYCTLSAVWAVDPGSTIRRIILTGMLFYTICLIARQISFVRMTDTIRMVCIVVLVLNLLTVVAFPGFGIHTSAEVDDPGLVGDWRGFMMQKNGLGALCACALIFCAMGESCLSKWTRWFGILLSAILLVQSGSKTSSGMIVLALVLGYLSMTYNPRYRRIVLPILAVLVVGLTLGIISNWAIISAPFQTEDSLTGRVQIWPILLAYYNDNPIWGAGYGSFWNIGPHSPVFAYTKLDSYVNEIASGHNGYLDQLVQIGAPGLGLAIFVMIVLPIVQSLTCETMTKHQRALLIATIVFCMCHNILESDMLDRDNIANIFWMVAIALVAQVRHEESLGRLRAPRMQSRFQGYALDSLENAHDVSTRASPDPVR